MAYLYKGIKTESRFLLVQRKRIVSSINARWKSLQAERHIFRSKFYKSFDVKFANAEGKKNMFGDLGVFQQD
jgi:hypothetical protein